MKFAFINSKNTIWCKLSSYLFYFPFISFQIIKASLFCLFYMFVLSLFSQLVSSVSVAMLNTVFVPRKVSKILFKYVGNYFSISFGGAFLL